MRKSIHLNFSCIAKEPSRGILLMQLLFLLKPYRCSGNHNFVCLVANFAHFVFVSLLVVLKGFFGKLQPCRNIRKDRCQIHIETPSKIERCPYPCLLRHCRELDNYKLRYIVLFRHLELCKDDPVL